MRRRRRRGRLWLWPLVLLTFGGVALLVPRLVDALPQPWERGRIIDEYTGQPIAGAVIRSSAGSATSRETGGFVPPQGERFTVEAEGYLPREVSAAEVSAVALRPSVLAGGVVDAADGQPIAGASISIGTMVVRSNAEGIYRIPNVEPEPVVVVKAPGYARRILRPVRTSRLDVQLTRQPVRAVYMSAATLAYDPGREQLLSSLSRNGLNAIVIDLKTDRGTLSYASSVALARAIGASGGGDLAAVVRRLKAQDVYVIGRIVVFRDRVLAQARPEWAIKDRRRGDAVYTDPEGGQWIDPFRREVWDYHAALAEEAAALGFDEVQFDYLRFPIDGTGDHFVYSAPATPESRPAALQGFLNLVNERVRPTGLFVSVNVFGYLVWNGGELGYGQDLEHLATLVDYISPTLYPSTFGGGVPGLGDRNNAIANPYELVRRSLEEAKRRLKGDAVRLRPWLQYFDDYAYQTGKRYDALEITAQLRAAVDAGASGWMFWDPTNLYARGGFERRP
ncbi:MAG: GTP-binding protein [Dehalococcoidia bacterium]|nr:MAG: GTP-binding protein [Dehalococcoidia bacterium]